MKIFVTGGAGYIGSVCAELLLDEGHSVSILDNLSEGHRAALDPRAEFFHGDLEDRQSIESALTKQKPDAAMHFAANALVGDVRGKSYASIVDPAYLSLAREQFTRKLLGKRVTDYEIVLVTKDGSRAPIEVSSA